MRRTSRNSRRPVLCALVIFLLPGLLHPQTAKKPPEIPQVVDKGSFRVSAPPGGGWKVGEEQGTGGVIFRKKKSSILDFEPGRFEIRVRQISQEMYDWRMTGEDALKMAMDEAGTKVRAHGLSPEIGGLEVEGKKLRFLTFRTEMTLDRPSSHGDDMDFVITKPSFSLLPFYDPEETISNLDAYYCFYFPPDFELAHRYFEILYGSYVPSGPRFYKKLGLEPVRAVVASLEIVDPLQAVAGPDGELLRAAAAGDAETVRAAIEKGAKADAAAARMTALGAAALYGRRDIVEFLIGQGADVNKPDEEGGRTPLHQALIGGEPEVAEALIKAGADVNLPTKEGFTALIYASGTGETGLVKTLVERGAGVSAKAGDGRTALMLAADLGSYEIAGLLVDAGADVNARAADGSTALMHALGLRRAAVTGYLLGKGADINLMTVDGWTALMAAVNSGDQAAALDLMQRGADVNAKTKDGRTALMMASEAGQAGVVKRLIEKGADVNAKDGKKQTALKIAKKTKNKEIVKILQAAGAKG